MPYFTTSGIQVRYLKITEPKVCLASCLILFLQPGKANDHFPTNPSPAPIPITSLGTVHYPIRRHCCKVARRRVRRHCGFPTAGGKLVRIVCWSVRRFQRWTWKGRMSCRRPTSRVRTTSFTDKSRVRREEAPYQHVHNRQPRWNP